MPGKDREVGKNSKHSLKKKINLLAFSGVNTECLNFLLKLRVKGFKIYIYFTGFIDLSNYLFIVCRGCGHT